MSVITNELKEMINEAVWTGYKSFRYYNPELKQIHFIFATRHSEVKEPADYETYLEDIECLQKFHHLVRIDENEVYGIISWLNFDEEWEELDGIIAQEYLTYIFYDEKNGKVLNIHRSKNTIKEYFKKNYKRRRKTRLSFFQLFPQYSRWIFEFQIYAARGLGEQRIPLK